MIKHGNAPAVSVSVHKPHGGYVASVASQPHAAPQSVHGYGGYEKPIAAVHAPAALPHHGSYHPAPAYAPEPYPPAPAYAPEPYHPTPVYHPKPYHPAPTYTPKPYHPAPVYTPAPYHPEPEPYHPAPYHPKPEPYHPAPAYKPAPYHPAPAYKEPEYEGPPEPYTYEYAVADDYSKAAFKAHETSDGKAVQGSYSVNLPDGRTQHVTYTADHYNGYIAEVTYEGTPVYPEEKPYHPAPAPYHPAPAPYHPKPAPYHPKPAPYHPTPAPYGPTPVYG